MPVSILTKNGYYKYRHQFNPPVELLFLTKSNVIYIGFTCNFIFQYI